MINDRFGPGKFPRVVESGQEKPDRIHTQGIRGPLQGVDSGPAYTKNNQVWSALYLEK